MIFEKIKYGCCGIYELINKKTGLRYIGQSTNMRARWLQHAKHLHTGRHCNPHLSASFAKWYAQLGNDDFIEFKIIELLPSSTLVHRNEREEWWITTAFEHGIKLYNVRLKPTMDRTMFSKDEQATREKLKLKGKRQTGKIPWNKGKKMPEKSGETTIIMARK